MMQSLSAVDCQTWTFNILVRIGWLYSAYTCVFRRTLSMNNCIFFWLSPFHSSQTNFADVAKAICLVKCRQIDLSPILLDQSAAYENTESLSSPLSLQFSFYCPLCQLIILTFPILCKSLMELCSWSHLGLNDFLSVLLGLFLPVL